jgi:hypothetical protein
VLSIFELFSGIYEENYETPPSKSEFRDKLLEPGTSWNRNVNHSPEPNVVGVVSSKHLRQEWNLQVSALQGNRTAVYLPCVMEPAFYLKTMTGI